MKALSICSAAVVLAASATIALAQYPPRYGYPVFYARAATPAESLARGLSSLIRARGQAGLDAAAAAIYFSEARRREIENQKLRTETYFETRRINRQARAERRGGRKTQEDYVRYARARAPKRLSPSELDAVTGEISWPTVLQEASFTGQRAALDRLFARRATNGAVSPIDHATINRITEAMLNKLNSEIRRVQPADYTTARRFLASLAYEVRLPAG